MMHWHIRGKEVIEAAAQERTTPVNSIVSG
jgi:hypothetical protein